MPSVGVVRDRLLTGTWLWRTRLTNNGLLRNLAMAMASSFNCFGTNQRRLACGAHLWIKVGCFLHHAPEARVPAMVKVGASTAEDRIKVLPEVG